MASYVLRYKVERNTDRDGRTLFFVIRSGSRSRPHKFFFPERSPEVPPFEGASAWFEVEKTHRGEWKFLRQIEER